MQSPPFPRYLVPPRSKYSPQHHILKHHQLPFLPQCQRPSNTPIQNNRQNYYYYCFILRGRSFILPPQDLWLPWLNTGFHAPRNERKSFQIFFFAISSSGEYLLPSTNRPLAWPSLDMSQTIKTTGHFLLFTDDVFRFTSSLNLANPGCSLHLRH